MTGRRQVVEGNNSKWPRVVGAIRQTGL